MAAGKFLLSRAKRCLELCGHSERALSSEVPVQRQQKNSFAVSFGATKTTQGTPQAKTSVLRCWSNKKMSCFRSALAFGFFGSGVWGLLNPNRACPGCGGGFGQTTNEDHVGPRPRSAPPGATCLAPLDTTQSHPPPLHGRGCDCGRGTATEERAISIETLNPKP